MLANTALDTSFFRLAYSGDSVAREWLSKHILGLPTQRLEHSGGEAPIKLVIAYEDESGDTDTSA